MNLRSFDSLRDFIASSSVATLVDFPFAVIFVLVVGLIAWNMLIPIGIGIAAIVIYGLATQGTLRELSATTSRAGAQRNSTLIESLVGMETIKAIGAESRIQRRWEQTSSFLARVNVQQRTIANSTANFTHWAQHMVTLGIVVTGVYLIVDGRLTLGGLIACQILGIRAIGPFGRVSNMLLQYHNAAVALENLDGIMEIPLERPEGVQFLSRENFKGDIEFKDVCFTYPDSEVESLSHVSFKISAGEHVAILGRMGSGKSTIQKLCMGLYEPSSGSILIDGIDLRQLDPTEFRSQVGYAPQDVTLFYGSLRDNLTLAHPEARDSELIAAARVASLLEFINKHPRGFDMSIGERGESLSGGQRKSVALARALVHRPSILLMDEPTGSMDRSTEQVVKRRLNRYIKGRTWLVVTHRNLLLDLVDRIIVIDNGKLVADGSRDTVLDALKQGKIGKAT
jgi:ATP-binding cassette subfamily C protein LapB